MSVQAIEGRGVVSFGSHAARGQGVAGSRYVVAATALAALVLLGGLFVGARVAPVHAEQTGGLGGLQLAMVDPVSPLSSHAREEAGTASSLDAPARAIVGMDAATETVRVLPGETLWDIAARAFPQADPRAAVMAFREANGGQLSMLRAGDRLIVPASL